MSTHNIGFYEDLTKNINYMYHEICTLSHLLTHCRTVCSSSIRQCGQVCQGQEQLLFAWAKNAQPLQLPKDVGLYIGPGAGISYIVLQVHYARVFAGRFPQCFRDFCLFILTESFD